MWTCVYGHINLIFSFSPSNEQNKGVDLYTSGHLIPTLQPTNLTELGFIYATSLVSLFKS